LSGGVAKTPDLDLLLSNIFKMPVRVADPTDYYQMPPGRDEADYISAIGTIRYILNKERNPFKFIDEPMLDAFHGKPGVEPVVVKNKAKPSAVWVQLRKFLERLKESFKELF
jgi:cell division protein FtsA